MLQDQSLCEGVFSIPRDTEARMATTEPPAHSTVLVLDFGSQYTQLITRRVREMGVLSHLLPGDASMVSTSVSQNLMPS